ncbi:Uncharacterised protein [Peptoniphilus indolicus]|uniref:Uncharacterized protein n=1 Tax=Peptoniphilus indolicus TaxID=33030 RepID=A0A379D983_9FIRM|nr:Uncharacterised protein [Peptoniphilus indolicus]
MKKQVTLRLPKDLYEALSKVSDEYGINNSNFVVLSILDYLDLMPSIHQQLSELNET